MDIAEPVDDRSRDRQSFRRLGPMDVVEALAQLGGEASPRQVHKLTSRQALRKALETGRVVRVRQGLVALPALADGLSAARTAHGAQSHLSAALAHGWEVKRRPSLPMVTVPRNRRLTDERRTLMRVFWGTLTDDELADRLTAPARTVIDCARALPFDEALAVADSALRSGAVSMEDLRAAEAAAARTGGPAVRRVLAAADGRAANPFESVLRAIALQVDGLDVEPQLQIGDARVDLADERLRIVIEAESWEFHAGQDGFRRDVRRYTELVRQGWLVVRFVWEDVMHDPELVHEVLADVVRQREGSSRPAIGSPERQMAGLSDQLPSRGPTVASLGLMSGS